jgi:hypothetical protein
LEAQDHAAKEAVPAKALQTPAASAPTTVTKSQSPPQTLRRTKYLPLQLEDGWKCRNHFTEHKVFIR